MKCHICIIPHDLRSCQEGQNRLTGLWILLAKQRRRPVFCIRLEAFTLRSLGKVHYTSREKDQKTCNGKHNRTNWIKTKCNFYPQQLRKWMRGLALPCRKEEAKHQAIEIHFHFHFYFITISFKWSLKAHQMANGCLPWQLFLLILPIPMPGHLFLPPPQT